MSVNSNTKKRIIAVSIGAGINLLLFFVKLYIGLSSNSVAIYADSLNSLTDSAVCIAAGIGFCLSGEKPNGKYPFGKGRAEELTELIISGVILVSGGAFFYISFERILYPVPVWYSSAYAAVIAVTAAVKLAVSFCFGKYSEKFNSETIRGIAADSRLDFLITLCTLISFTLSSKAEFSVDGFAGVIISIILVIEGIKAVLAAFAKIIGKRNDVLCNNAKKVIEEIADNISVNEIQHHSYGEKGVFTADIRAECVTAQELEELTVRLQNAIKENFNSQLYLSFGGENEK